MKSAKKVNFLYLVIVIVSTLGSLFVSLLATKNINIPIVLNLIISQCLILVPGLIFLFFNFKDYKEDLCGDKIKISSFFLFIVLTELIMPLASAANLFSQLFTTNTMVELSDQIADAPLVAVFLMMGILGPVSEELVFRGIIFKGLKKCSGRVITSAVVSALFFGLLHMNLNQLCYAFLLGIIFAFIDEIMDSLIPSVVMHCVINSQNVLLLIAASKLVEYTGKDLSNAYDSTLAGSKNFILIMFIIFLGFSLITTILAGLLLYGIALIEGKEKRFKNFFAKNANDNKAKVLTVSGIIGMLICIFIIFALEPLVKYIQAM